MWLAMDVVYDDTYNAFVVDVNSGPSFYHEHKWPYWFVKERSALVREAIDFIQEAAFLKVCMRFYRRLGYRVRIDQFCVGGILEQGGLTYVVNLI
jgi:hypothetical protein